MADLQAIARGDQPSMRPFKPMKMRDRVSRPVQAPGEMDDPAFWWKGKPSQDTRTVTINGRTIRVVAK